MIDWTHAVAFVAGLFARAAADGLRDMFNDWRRKRDAVATERRRFASVEAQCKKLIDEMRVDVRANASIRRFFIVEQRGFVFTLGPDGDAFMYYMTDHDNLAGQCHILEGEGYIIDVTAAGKKTTQYRMTEEFVRLLRA